jgi:hypothetical protein
MLSKLVKNKYYYSKISKEMLVKILLKATTTITRW